MYWIVILSAWEKIKKVPMWTMGLVLFLAAIGVYFYKQAQIKVKVAKIRKEQVEIEKDRFEIMQQIGTTHEVKSRAIDKKYRIRLLQLEKEKIKLLRTADKGPGEIAKAWKEYLEKK
tara:strand:- start:624 stop:974 length:351 start_codon:yes stop_codon:yes gene_type:complete